MLGCQTWRFMRGWRFEPPNGSRDLHGTRAGLVSWRVLSPTGSSAKRVPELRSADGSMGIRLCSGRRGIHVGALKEVARPGDCETGVWRSSRVSMLAGSELLSPRKAVTSVPRQKIGTHANLLMILTLKTRRHIKTWSKKVSTFSICKVSSWHDWPSAKSPPANLHPKAKLKPSGSIDNISQDPLLP